MGKRKNDTLSRKKPFREYRQICWVSTEGRTEQDYFQMSVFKRKDGPTVRFPRNIHPDRRNPRQVMKRFEKAMKKEDFRKGDEAWLVVDVDSWSDEEFEELLRWQSGDSRRHLAVSNPKFELFLLMHFESASGCTTSQSVDAALKRHMPHYNKRLRPTEFDAKAVKTAIQNAHEKRKSCKSALPQAGITDAHLLAERLLAYLFA